MFSYQLAFGKLWDIDLVIVTCFNLLNTPLCMMYVIIMVIDVYQDSVFDNMQFYYVCVF